MDKGTTGAVLGTILGLLAGVAGMFFLGVSRDAADQQQEWQARVNKLESERNALQTELDGLKSELARLRDEAGKTRTTGSDLASEYDRLSSAKAEAEAKAGALKDELDLLKRKGGESSRQDEARIGELEALLEKNGIYSHLSPEEIKARITKHKDAFELAFSTKDKKAVMSSLWEIQKLGPTAYDTAIEMWRQAANDFGMNPFGQGPGTLGLTFQEYVSLVSSYGMVQKGLTDPNVPSDFRISSLYGLPWWSNESAPERVKLAGDVLKNSSGYESGVAIEALRDINDPTSIRYLSEYLGANTDNTAARKSAIGALQLKNTTESWAAIEHAAKNDPDEGVRKTAQAAMATRDVSVEGVLITWVGENSQGALAGIKVNDILTSYNGVHIKTLEDVNKAKQAVAEGQSVTVIVRRGSDELSLQLGPGTIGINGTAVSPRK